MGVFGGFWWFFGLLVFGVVVGGLFGFVLVGWVFLLFWGFLGVFFVNRIANKYSKFNNCIVLIYLIFKSVYFSPE